MILKGSQRGNGADLAIHLMNGYDNERVEIADVYGTVSQDLYGAFAEIEAVAAGTKATKPLYSLSINPPEPITREQYAEAIEAIEKRLGLTGQPRAIVFHVKADKHGIPREHCHVVWSRINAEKMQAIHMAHDHRKLCDLACELARKYGLELPPGLKAWEKKHRFEKEALEPSLAEKAQHEATGISPEERRAEITAAFQQSDTAEAFRNALEQKGYVLAAGERRGFVVVDRFANVHSLSRYIQGHSAKQIRARLAPLTPEQLPSVDEAKELVRRRKQAQDERQREQQAQTDDLLEEAIRQREAELSSLHEARRAVLRGREQELLIRHQHERMMLHAAQKAETRSIMFRARSTVADLIARTPGLRSVLGPIQKITGIDPRIRHVMEREALARRHGREKAAFARRAKALARLEAREKASLRKASKRELAPQLLRDWKRQQAQDQKNVARQDFFEAARDQRRWQDRKFERGDMRTQFNDAAEAIESYSRAGEDESGRERDRKSSVESRTRSRGRARRRSRGFRRESD